MAQISPPERFVRNALDTLEDRGLTVGWLARRIDVPDSTLRFQLSNPESLKLRTALAIAAELGLPSSVLAGAA